MSAHGKVPVLKVQSIVRPGIGTNSYLHILPKGTDRDPIIEHSCGKGQGSGETQATVYLGEGAAGQDVEGDAEAVVRRLAPRGGILTVVKVKLPFAGNIGRDGYLDGATIYADNSPARSRSTVQ